MAEGSSTPEFYIPQQTETIKTSLYEENSDVLKTIPFKLPDPFVSVPADFGNESFIVRVSREQGRALTDRRINAKVVFGKLDNPLGSIDWKGSTMEDPSLSKDECGIQGLRTNGLKDKLGKQNIIRASEVLIKKGLPTEVPLRTFVVEEIFERGKKISVNEWKTKQIELSRSGKNDLPPENVEKYLNDSDFYIMERGLQVADRLRDFYHIKDASSMEKELERIFKWVNALTQTKKEGIIAGTPLPEPFDVGKPENIRRYFEDWLPAQMGTYMGRMHRENISHGFPHGQNWSMVGTLYDLDSVKGAEINGYTPTQKDYEKDIAFCGDALSELQYLFETGVIRKYTKEKQIEVFLPYKAKKSFLDAYVKERFPELFDGALSKEEKLAKISPYESAFISAGFGSGQYTRENTPYGNVWSEFIQNL